MRNVKLSYGLHSIVDKIRMSVMIFIAESESMQDNLKATIQTRGVIYGTPLVRFVPKPFIVLEIIDERGKNTDGSITLNRKDQLNLVCNMRAFINTYNSSYRKIYRIDNNGMMAGIYNYSDEYNRACIRFTVGREEKSVEIAPSYEVTEATGAMIPAVKFAFGNGAYVLISYSDFRLLYEYLSKVDMDNIALSLLSAYLSSKDSLDLPGAKDAISINPDDVAPNTVSELDAQKEYVNRPVPLVSSSTVFGEYLNDTK